MSETTGAISSVEVERPVLNATDMLRSHAQADAAMRFVRIAVNLSSEKDLKKLMDLITREAQELTSASRGSLYLIDHENKKLMFYVTDNESFAEMKIDLTSASISGYVGLTGVSLMIDDVYQIDESKPYKFNKSFDMKTGFRTKSMLVVPLNSHKNETIGVIQLINKKTGEEIIGFTEKDLEMIQAIGSLAAVSIENALLYKEIENLFESFVRYSATAIDERDPCTGGHSRRVAMYSTELAKAMGTFTQDEIKEIKYASWLHDIGKIGVKEAVLNKENKLTAAELEALKSRLAAICEKKTSDAYEEFLESQTKHPAIPLYEAFRTMKDNIEKYRTETAGMVEFITQINFPGFLSDDKAKRLNEIKASTYTDRSGKLWNYLSDFEFENLKVVRGNLRSSELDEMQSHAAKTYEILKHIPFTRELKHVAEIAAKHHEKLDGTGYPSRLPMAEIPVQSRIIAISDIYDALVSQDRPYKKAMTPEVALKILNEEADKGKLDREILNVFIEKGVYKTTEKAKI